MTTEQVEQAEQAVEAPKHRTRFELDRAVFACIELVRKDTQHDVLRGVRIDPAQGTMTGVNGFTAVTFPIVHRNCVPLHVEGEVPEPFVIPIDTVAEFRRRIKWKSRVFFSIDADGVYRLEGQKKASDDQFDVIVPFYPNLQPFPDLRAYERTPDTHLYKIVLTPEVLDELARAAKRSDQKDIVLEFDFYMPTTAIGLTFRVGEAQVGTGIVMPCVNKWVDAEAQRLAPVWDKRMDQAREKKEREKKLHLPASKQ